MTGRVGGAALVVLLAAALTGCGVADGAESGSGEPSQPAPSSAASVSPAAPSPSPAAPSLSETAPEQPAEPRRAWLSIPALGVRDVPVVRYRGSPDDGPGTRIQNRGPAASPRGPDGGVGPGEVGNYIVTGHRTSHDAPFRDLPSLRGGDHVLVRSGDTVYDYVIAETREVSFRSARSKAAQVAAVPGRPGEPSVEPVITLSTCATPEDRAAGNYWSDEFGNPEHRIDKIGVLTEVRPARLEVVAG
ncbi:MAG TPA: class E sortase [Actinomycetes bacterium]|nr:class E sortase [Actinomycetes bacterium]